MEAEIGTQLSMLFMALLGLIETVFVTLLRYMSDGINKLPKPAKAILVGAIAIPIAWLSGTIGIDLPADPTTWDGTVVNSILLWLSAMGLNAFGNAVISKDPPSS